MSFEDSIRYKGDLPLVANMDFETTAPTENCLNPEQKMFIVSYVVIFAFHPKLNLEHVVVQRSFGRTYKKLTIIDYLTNNQTVSINIELVKQLKDCAINVRQRKCKNAVAQMFCVEFRFVADSLLFWPNRGFKSRNLELNLDKKLLYRQKIISIETAINVPTKINAKVPNVPNPEMSYTDFYIR